MTTIPMPAPAGALALRGPLDEVAVAHVQDHLARLDGTREVRVDLRGITAVDPVAAARLWRIARSLQAAGCALRLQRLPARFARRLRLHPLIAFVEGEERIFSDPFATPLPSAR